MATTKLRFLAHAVGLMQAEIVTRVPSTFLGEMYTGTGLLPADACGGTNPLFS